MDFNIIISLNNTIFGRNLKNTLMSKENLIEEELVQKLVELKYTRRIDIKDRASLEQNFRAKFEALNKVNLSNAEFARLRDEIIKPDVFPASKILRQKNYYIIL